MSNPSKMLLFPDNLLRYISNDLNISILTLSNFQTKFTLYYVKGLKNKRMLPLLLYLEVSLQKIAFVSSFLSKRLLFCYIQKS